MYRHAIRSLLFISVSLNFVYGHPIEVMKTTRIFTDDFMPAGSTCTRGGPFDYPKCAPGTWCIGKTKLRCTKLRTPGESCGTEYEICSRGSICNSTNVCEATPALETHYVKQNGTCISGKAPKCLPGLWCILGKCRKLVPCGKPCTLKWQRCRPGLKCRTIYPSKEKVCTRFFGSQKVLQEGESCSNNSTSKCLTGLRCVIISGNKRECRIPKRLGETCIRGAGMCEYERECTKTKYSEGKTICVERMEIGEKCDEKYSVCKERLRCSEEESADRKCVEQQ